MSDIAETIKKLETECPKQNPSSILLKKNPSVILLKDNRYKQGTEVSLNDLDSNKLYYFKFKAIRGSFDYKYNLPLQVDEIREKIETFGHNKKYYVIEIKQKNK